MYYNSKKQAVNVMAGVPYVWTRESSDIYLFSPHSLLLILGREPTPFPLPLKT